MKKIPTINLVIAIVITLAVVLLMFITDVKANPVQLISSPSYQKLEVKGTVTPPQASYNQQIHTVGDQPITVIGNEYY